MMGWDGGNNVGLYAGFASSQAKQAEVVYASGAPIPFGNLSMGAFTMHFQMVPMSRFLPE